MDIRAAVVRECNQLSIETVELSPPQPGEVLVRIAAAGVCHSDLHTLRCELRARPPLVLGHEGAGIVEAIGDGVTSVRPGDRVLINWLPACEQCPTCLEGHSNLCERLSETTFKGLLPDGTTRLTAQDGTPLKHLLSAATMAERVVVSEAGVIPIGEDVPFEVAAIIGCAVMTGVGAVINTAQVTPGSSAAIIGCGGVGLSILLGCRLAGCYPIIAVDVQESKLELARQLGATETVNAATVDPVSALRELTRKGPEYVFDSVGASTTISQALQAAAPYGTVTVTGMGDVLKPTPIPTDALIFSNKRLLGSFVGSSRPRVDLPKLIELYLGGRLPLDQLISQRYPLDELPNAFADMEGGSVARGVVIFDH